MYRLHSIRKCYGSNVALDIEELTIAEGRLYTLTGANGAGKSTLLNILAFLTPPTSGEIFYTGKRVDREHGSLEELRKKVTLLHQSPYLFGGTVYANVAFGLKARGIQGEEQRQRPTRRSTSWAFWDSARGRRGNCPEGRRSGWLWPGPWR